MPDSAKNRRPAHPHAVSSFTRKQRKDYPNMHPEGHVYMDEKYHKDTRKYNASKKKVAAYKKAHGITGGRRRGRKSRSTRRR
jgi:hypothetical protein